MGKDGKFNVLCVGWSGLMAAFIMLSLVIWPYQDVKDLPDGRWGKTANSMYYALGGQGGPAWGV